MANTPHLALADVTTSGDGTNTTKYRFAADEGNSVESVLLPSLEAASVSTQVGCRMGCRFCGVGESPRVLRNLHAHEIVAQVLAMQTSANTGIESSPPSIRNLFYFGMGEPLANFDNVLGSMEQFHRMGIERFAVASCGLVPMFPQLAKIPLAIRLFVSLHAPNNRLRSELMPINRQYPIEALLEGILEYRRSSFLGQPVYVNYVMLRGINDSPDAMMELGRLLEDYRTDVIVLLKLFNRIDTLPLRGTSRRQIRRCVRVLESCGVCCHYTESYGRDINAGGGQLTPGSPFTAGEEGKRGQ